MNVWRKFAVSISLFAALLVGTNPALATPQGKQQNFFSLFSKPKAQPTTPLRKQNGCDNFFSCLFNDSGNPFTGGSPFETHFRQVVDFEDGRFTPGSIVIRTPERALYYVLPESKAIRYRVGVGRDGFQWSGSSHIVAKQQWPSWTPPARMIAREAAKGHIIPAFMEGGPNNPLGARALYIGGTIFRIHGTNDARSIGGAVSSGCIRMLNADVIELYEKVRVGAPVYVYQ